MCLNRNTQDNPLMIADRDIECFKVVRILRKDRDKRKTRILYRLRLLKHFKTFFQESPITIGKTVKASPVFDKDELDVINARRTTLNRGFIHSYKNPEDAQEALGWFKYTILVKCIIPKGTYYFTGKDDDGNDNYASCAIKYVKVIKCLSKLKQL